MINLGRCIVYLLSRNDQVTLPGIGIFLRKDQPGYLDVNQQCYHVTQSQIHFESDQSAQDAQQLLANYIAKQRLMPLNEAQELLKSSIAKLLQDIQREGNVILAGLGVLTECQGKFEFTLSEDSGFNKKATPAKDRSIKTVNSDIDNANIETRVQVEDVYAEEVEARVKKFYVWAYVAVAVLLMAGIVVATYYLRPDVYRQGEEFVLTQRAKLFGKEAPKVKPWMPATVQDTVPTIDSADLALLDSAAILIGEQNVDSLSIVGQQNNNQPKVTYEIIVGSFTSMELAQKYVVEMKAKGIEVYAMDSKMPGNRKKVSFGSYATEAEAYRVLEEVKRKIEPGAWVARVER